MQEFGIDTRISHKNAKDCGFHKTQKCIWCKTLTYLVSMFYMIKWMHDHVLHQQHLRHIQAGFHIIIIAAIGTAISVLSMFWITKNIHDYVLHGSGILGYVNVLHHMNLTAHFAIASKHKPGQEMMLQCIHYASEMQWISLLEIIGNIICQRTLPSQSAKWKSTK